MPLTSSGDNVVYARSSIEDEMCDDCGEDIGAGAWRVELIDPDEWLHVHCAEARGWDVRCEP